MPYFDLISFNKVQSVAFKQGKFDPGVTLPPCRGLWGTLHIGTILIVILVPLGVPRVESHLFTVGGFLGNSKGMA